MAYWTWQAPIFHKSVNSSIYNAHNKVKNTSNLRRSHINHARSMRWRLASRLCRLASSGTPNCSCAWLLCHAFT